jgi:hypothetical protein
MTSSTDLTLADVGRLFFVNDEVSINLLQPALLALLAPIALFLILWQLIPSSTSSPSYDFDSRFTDTGDPYAMTSLDYAASARGGVAGPSSGQRSVDARLLERMDTQEDGSDYKDFYKSGKKEDFPSFDEY